MAQACKVDGCKGSLVWDKRFFRRSKTQKMMRCTLNGVHSYIQRTVVEVADHDHVGCCGKGPEQSSV